MESQTGRIVVGYDGSPPSTVALDWAAAEAQRRRLPLTVLHAVDFGTARPAPADAPLYPALNQEVSTEVAREGAARAQKVAASLEITALAHLGQATHTLIDASRGAELVVVGAHSGGAVSTALLGSTAVAVSARALCPVVVVRSDPASPPAPPRPVVVGIDGSACAAAALLYAADLAGATGSALIVVSAYQPSLVDIRAGARHDATSMSDPGPDLKAPPGAAAVTMATDAVRSATHLHPGLDASSLVLEGTAAEVLCRAAVNAQMLVVGSRGHGGFAGLILGSVSRDVILRAPGLVTIIKTAALEAR
jgi:nucleotide-binding universal stress UspA family protein